MSQFDFTGIEPAKGGSMTLPGTIGMFEITNVEFVTSTQKGTSGMKLTFAGEDASTFTHTFWLTPDALSRIQYIAKYAVKKTFSGQMTEVQLTAAFKGKKLPLKVIGQVSTTNGKGYPDLAFAGFSGETVEELQFSTRDQQLIDAALTAMKNSAVNNADVEKASAPAVTAQSDDEF